MFLPDDQIERHALRQGDIVSALHMVGSLHIEGILVSADAQGRQVSWHVQKAPEYRDAAVLSHSCEIATENGVKFTSIVMAPIRDLDGATEKDKIQDLIGSNILVEGVQASFLKYFYLPPNDRLQYKNGAVVDFSKCFSVRKNSYNHLLGKKALQMVPEIRQAFALKLALYFCRTHQPVAVAA
jgi:hypothetical protein